MNINDLLNEDGRIVKGVNTTVDVSPNEIKTQAAKFGNTVDKDGRPPTLSKKVKGKSTNVLFNLGLSENFDPVAWIKDKLSSDPSYKAWRRMFQQNPQKARSTFPKRHREFLAQFKGESIEEQWSAKYKRSINCSNPKGFSQKAHCAGRKKNESLDTIEMLARKWNVSTKEILTQVKKGIKVESKHTKDFDIAMEITLDHLNEDTKHYEKLKFIEAEGLGEIASSSQIYVDMDGVLADFFGEWAKLMDVEHFTQINKKHDIDDALQKIRDTDDFWLRLPILPEAKKLLNLIKQVKGSYNICSSPLADDPNSEKHKRTWVEKNLSFFPPNNVYITHDKAQYATQPDGTPNILIDDYGVNIRKWEAAGGIGFKYKDHKFERTAKAIKQYMTEPVKSEDQHPNERPLGPEFKPTMPAGSIRVKVSDVYDWYKLGMHISDLPNLDANDFGKGPPEAVIAFGSEEEEHKYIKLLQKLGLDILDIDPGAPDAKGVETDPTYNTENFADGKKPGRKGLAKRSGVNTKASVSSLRKTAKNSTGEKARMAHWLANMKAGRAKKK